MSKRSVLLILMLALFHLAASAQKVPKPTLTPAVPTDAQKAAINEGVKLHDAKKYEEAIRKYEEVLKECPDCDVALYELALSAYEAKDFTKALEAGYKLVKYRSRDAVAGYGILANISDDQGKPEEAIEIYKLSIKYLQDEKGMEPQVSSLYYNLAVTHTRQRKMKEAREALKNAVIYNFAYPSPHYLLTRVFATEKFNIPALLSAFRLVTLETNTERSSQAVAFIRSQIKEPEKNEKGAYTINLDFFGSKEEGEFGVLELLLGTIMVIDEEKDKDNKLTQGEKFSSAVDSVISFLDDKKIKSSFVGKTYVPFLLEMKTKGHSKTFAYLILQQSGDAEGKEWLTKNSQKLADLLNWAKAYQLSK